MPVVTAMNGPAVGIGMSLALDGRSDRDGEVTASFLLSFARIGLVPDGGLTCVVTAGLSDVTRARETGAAGRTADGGKGAGMGARSTGCWRTSNCRNEALGPGATPGRWARRPCRMTRHCSRTARRYEAQLAREAAGQQRAGETEDFAEGLKAFLEKREPKFQGTSSQSQFATRGELGAFARSG